MKTEEVKQEFWRLIDVVAKAWHETYNLDELEPSLLSVLNLSKQHPEFRQTLEQCYIELIQTPKGGAVEILEFCMHELRWPAVKSAIEEIVMNTSNIRLRDALWQISEAYSDDWDGIEYYEYYSQG